MVQLISNITEITHDSLKFINDENQEEEISFSECSKNWVEYFNSRDDFVTWGDWKPAPKITVESNKCVGQRDWFADNPYFEFFSNP